MNNRFSAPRRHITIIGNVKVWHAGPMLLAPDWAAAATCSCINMLQDRLASCHLIVSVVQSCRSDSIWHPPEFKRKAVCYASAGLLATSGRDRLYHSQAWLTQNAEVLITGSEATEDYTIQIFTPPYLTGTFSR